MSNTDETKKSNNVLHALLAVESEKKRVSNKIIGEAVNTFKKKDSHFEGLTKIYKPNEEDGVQLPSEHKQVVDTVPNKIKYCSKFIVDAINAQVSKEETNASGEANAELEVDGTNFGKFSATSLLSLENTFVEVRKVYDNIPTLDPTRSWEKDGTQTHQFKTKPDIRITTEKVPQVIVKYDATKEHPAQTELVTLDRGVGQFETTYMSGKISPKDKSVLLERVDNLVTAVKVARSKANLAEVKQIKVAQKFFDFIHEDIIV